MPQSKEGGAIPSFSSASARSACFRMPHLIRSCSCMRTGSNHLCHPHRGHGLLLPLRRTGCVVRSLGAHILLRVCAFVSDAGTAAKEHLTDDYQSSSSVRRTQSISSQYQGSARPSLALFCPCPPSRCLQLCRSCGCDNCSDLFGRLCWTPERRIKQPVRHDGARLVQQKILRRPFLLPQTLIPTSLSASLLSQFHLPGRFDLFRPPLGRERDL